MDDFGGFDSPVSNMNARAVRHFGDDGAGPLPGQNSAPPFVNELAAGVSCSCIEVRPEGAVCPEESLRHANQRRRTVHVEVGDLARALVPAGEYDTRVVHTVVVVEMGQKETRQRLGRDGRFEEASGDTRTAVEQQDFLVEPDEVSGARAVVEGGGGPGAQKGQL